MGDNNDTQQVNTVSQFEFGFTKLGERTVIHGGFVYQTLLDRSLGVSCTD
jgi:hypothetical protein